MPVAMPRRSGNHFTSVLTGEMYPSPQPMPPMMPMPRNTRTDCAAARPTPPIRRPVPKNSAAAVAATRGRALDPRPAERGAQSEQRERGGEGRVRRAEPPRAGERAPMGRLNGSTRRWSRSDAPPPPRAEDLGDHPPRMLTDCVQRCEGAVVGARRKRVHTETRRRSEGRSPR